MPEVQIRNGAAVANKLAWALVAFLFTICGAMVYKFIDLSAQSAISRDSVESMIETSITRERNMQDRLSEIRDEANQKEIDHMNESIRQLESRVGGMALSIEQLARLQGGR